MGEAVQFPARPAPDPERPITLAQYMHKGPPPVLTLRAALRWLPGFDPRAAAVRCVLVAETRDEATTWWRGHLLMFRAALSRRRLARDDVGRLALEYTLATKREVDLLRAERRPRGEWNLELVIGLAGGDAPPRPEAEAPSAPRAEGGA